jgi:hypothetical protein
MVQLSTMMLETALVFSHSGWHCRTGAQILNLMVLRNQDYAGHWGVINLEMKSCQGLTEERCHLDQNFWIVAFGNHLLLTCTTPGNSGERNPSATHVGAVTQLHMTHQCADSAAPSTRE